MDWGGRPGWSTRSGLDAKEWTKQDDRGGVPGRDWTLLILEQTGVDRPGSHKRCKAWALVMIGKDSPGMATRAGLDDLQGSDKEWTGVDDRGGVPGRDWTPRNGPSRTTGVEYPVGTGRF
ncbi:hypothetical protein Bca4012_026409 [Brassica carinata]